MQHLLHLTAPCLTRYHPRRPQLAAYQPKAHHGMPHCGAALTSVGTGAEVLSAAVISCRRRIIDVGCYTHLIGSVIAEAPEPEVVTGTAPSGRVGRVDRLEWAAGFAVVGESRRRARRSAWTANSASTWLWRQYKGDPNPWFTGEGKQTSFFKIGEISKRSPWTVRLYRGRYRRLSQQALSRPT